MWAAAFPCPAYFKPAKTWKETFRHFVIFFIIPELECCSYRCASVVLAMLTTLFDAWVFFWPFFLPSVPYFFPHCDILAMTDEGCAWVFKQPTQKNGYIFPFPFHVYFRNYFWRGFGVLHHVEITLCRRALFIFSQARKLRRAWPHQCIYSLNFPRYQGLLKEFFLFVFLACISQPGLFIYIEHSNTKRHNWILPVANSANKESTNFYSPMKPLSI